ncbi:MFS transporter [Aneurinibacillus sp. BA2021]|nr:MFS transporter [Aneurinibacillus sp. BA2021]
MNRSLVTNYKILWIICFAHLLNDMVTAIVPAMLPLFKRSLDLSYMQLGGIVFVATVSASFLQPLIGLITDKRPMPYLLPVGALIAGFGVAGISQAVTYSSILFMVLMIGIGSAVFHPEASKVTHLAAGARKGMAQSIFQVGGNAGQALGPLAIAMLFIPLGQSGALWFIIPSLLTIASLSMVARWYQRRLPEVAVKGKTLEGENQYGALALLVVVVMMRSWIHSGISSFLPLYITEARGLTVATAQYYAFVFLLAGALGTFLGGALSDKFSERKILLFSMAGSIPFTLLIPFLDGWLLYVNTFILGFISLSSFAVTVVYAQRLAPGKIGLVSGLMIGLAIGAGGVGATVLGFLADRIGLITVIELLIIFPVLGVVLGLKLPDMGARRIAPAARVDKNTGMRNLG